MIFNCTERECGGQIKTKLTPKAQTICASCAFWVWAGADMFPLLRDVTDDSLYILDQNPRAYLGPLVKVRSLDNVLEFTTGRLRCVGMQTRSGLKVRDVVLSMKD